MKVWFQNRRSKERRMKQLSTLGGRRHVFFRGQRRMRALGDRLEADELGHFSYYGGEEQWRSQRRSLVSLPPSLSLFLMMNELTGVN